MGEKLRYMLFGALLVAALIFLGAQAVSQEGKVGTYQVIARTGLPPVIILDTRTGQLFDEHGDWIGGVKDAAATR